MTVVVDIREVGPRDGLQAEPPVPVDQRVKLIEALLDAGIRHIEACSFVSPKAVPAMAGAHDVMAALPKRDDVRYVALVPNLRGAELAADAGMRHLSFTVSASPAYNERNVGMTVDDSLSELRLVSQLWAESGGTLDVVISCAFGSPYEGDISPSDVDQLGDRCLERGATSLTFADTTGMATPRRVSDLLDETGNDVGLHLHDTRGTALLNAWAAMAAGVRRFDTSVGGLGGSPFAAGAAGNLSTEDFVAVLDDVGAESGIDLDRLLEASRMVEWIVGHALPSRVAAAGPRSRRAD